MNLRKNKYKNDLPDWNTPFLEDCYTGPNWSDCKLQGSVAQGKHIPKSKLEMLSKRHDERFRLCGDDNCIYDADLEYYKNSRDLSFVPRTIGQMPLYFNRHKLRGTKGLDFQSKYQRENYLDVTSTDSNKIKLPALQGLNLMDKETEQQNADDYSFETCPAIPGTSSYKDRTPPVSITDVPVGATPAQTALYHTSEPVAIKRIGPSVQDFYKRRNQNMKVVLPQIRQADAYVDYRDYHDNKPRLHIKYKRRYNV